LLGQQQPCHSGAQRDETRRIAANVANLQSELIVLRDDSPKTGEAKDQI
jgi:hypothetical protein